VAVVSVNAAGFLADWPNFQGNLFHANLDLVNTGETIILRDQTKTNDIDIVSYSALQGANGDGNSLQKVNGVFVPLAPTPGTNYGCLRILNLSLGGWNGQSAGTISIDAPVGMVWPTQNLQLEFSSNLVDWTTAPILTTMASSNTPCSIIFPVDHFTPAQFFRIFWHN